jgi:hypothetical protein
MKHLRTIITVILSTALFYLAFLQTAFAATGQEDHIITLPQLLLLGFVWGLYLYNHFKDKIKAKFTKKQ